MSFILTSVVGLFKFGQYVDVKRSSQRQTKFENYHNLIERLNSPLKGANHTYLDVQKAAAFELRNYPEYKHLTKDILDNWIIRDTELSQIMRETLNELGL